MHDMIWYDTWFECFIENKQKLIWVSFMQLALFRNFNNNWNWLNCFCSYNEALELLKNGFQDYEEEGEENTETGNITDYSSAVSSNAVHSTNSNLEGTVSSSSDALRGVSKGAGMGLGGRSQMMWEASHRIAFTWVEQMIDWLFEWIIQVVRKSIIVPIEEDDWDHAEGKGRGWGWDAMRGCCYLATACSRGICHNCSHRAPDYPIAIATAALVLLCPSLALTDSGTTTGL